MVLLGKEYLDAILAADAGEPEEDRTDLIPEVSFNALKDEYAPSILHLKGAIPDKQVRILVDSGSTFNFVQARVAQKLGLVYTKVDPFKVFVGSGDFIWCKVMSPHVEVVVQGVMFLVDLYH